MATADGGGEPTDGNLRRERVGLRMKFRAQDEKVFVSVDYEPIEIRTLPTVEFDPDWRFTDTAGHAHSRESGKFPSLGWIVDRIYWCETCREDHNEGHYECKWCGEEIEPGTRTRPGLNETRPGLATYRINGEIVSEDEADRAIAELRARNGT